MVRMVDSPLRSSNSISSSSLWNLYWRYKSSEWRGATSCSSSLASQLIKRPTKEEGGDEEEPRLAAAAAGVTGAEGGRTAAGTDAVGRVGGGVITGVGGGSRLGVVGVARGCIIGVVVVAAVAFMVVLLLFPGRPAAAAFRSLRCCFFCSFQRIKASCRSCCSEVPTVGALLLGVGVTAGTAGEA